MKVKAMVFLSFLLVFLSWPLSREAGQMSPDKASLKQRDVERAQAYQDLHRAGASSLLSQSPLQALPPDTDDDGMPDEWEVAHGLNLNDPDDAWLDPDSDKVVNLFEYQLGSSPTSSATPPVMTVGPSGDYTDVETAIDSVAAGTCLHVAGGLYAVNYMTFDEKVIMIQGGYSANFAQRNLKRYPTTFDGGLEAEVLYFSISSGNPAIVLDGINFVNGSGHFGAVNLLAQGTAFMRTSLFNCTIIDSVDTSGFGGVLKTIGWDTSQADRTLANTLLANNSGSGIQGQTTDNAQARWRIIQSTISGNLNASGDNGRGIDFWTLDSGVLDGHIFNSIIWGNDESDLAIDGNITVEADHSDIGDVSAYDPAVYTPGTGMINADPKFMAPEPGNYRLQSTSPAINKGIAAGIPAVDLDGRNRIIGSAPDMGAYEYISLPAKEDFVATWAGQGVYYRNSNTGAWVRITSAASKITTGDLDSDDADDLIGIWPTQAGIWVKYSSDGQWAKLSSTADWIASGDMNGDWKIDLLGTWAGDGVYYRNSVTGVWVKIASAATKITAGDLDGDYVDDLIGDWAGSGVWVKLSTLGTQGRWFRIASPATWLAVGDMNGNKSVDLLGSWAGDGVYYMDTASMAWVKMASAATQIAAGDLDGDKIDDLIGIWSADGGVWVKYSKTGSWYRLSSTADWISAGRMRPAGTTSPESLALQSGMTDGPDIWEADSVVFQSQGPGGLNSVFINGKNLVPHESGSRWSLPGPGMPGFRCIVQKNLVPGKAS